MLSNRIIAPLMALPRRCRRFFQPGRIYIQPGNSLINLRMLQCIYRPLTETGGATSPG